MTRESSLSLQLEFRCDVFEVWHVKDGNPIETDLISLVELIENLGGTVPTCHVDNFVCSAVNGTTVGQGGYGNGSTAAAIAGDIVTSIKGNVNSLVTASLKGAVISLTSVIAGSTTNYSLPASVTYDSSHFSSAPFHATASGTTMTGGTGISASGLLHETYAYDRFGNLTQSGNFTFSQSFNALNQISGYAYDTNGDQSTDIYSHPLAFDANGMLSSVSSGGETYVYDAQGNRVEVHGATVTDYIYFGGVPIATLAGGAYTDLIYADARAHRASTRKDGSQEILLVTRTPIQPPTATPPMQHPRQRLSSNPYFFSDASRLTHLM